MKKKATRPVSRPAAARALERTAAATTPYPTSRTVDASVLERARRLCERWVLASAALGVAAVATGCEPPQCQPTRLGEVRVHGDTALTDVGDLRLHDAATDLGIGLGIVPHPFISAPGEMVPVSVAPPPPPLPAPPSTAADS